MTTFISNSFSMNMLDETMSSVDLIVDKFDPAKFNRVEDRDVVINVANQQTLDLLNKEWETAFKADKKSITLKPGDVLYVIQYNGPRIEENGAIPKAGKLRLYTVEVQEPVV